MKKIILAFIALSGILASCSKEDITISSPTTFKINAQTVIDKVYEMNSGDLIALRDGNKLNVTLYVFDESGVCVSKVSEQFDSYSHIMSADVYLPSGNYTAVATTHVSSSVEFWEFENTENLSTFKIKDLDRVGGGSKILGISVEDFYKGNDSQTINLNPEIVGAIAIVEVLEWKYCKYADVAGFYLLGKQSDDYITFDTYGKYDTSTSTKKEFSYIKDIVKYNPSISGTYSYFFTFPIKGASFQFAFYDTKDRYARFGPEFTGDINAGETEEFICYFNPDGTPEFLWTYVEPKNNNTKSVTLQEKTGNKVESINSHLVYDYNEQSISIKNYLNE